MRNSTTRRLAVTLLVAALVVLGGCGGKPMPFPTPESEMGDRPGLLTGDKGVWQLYPAAPTSPQPR